MAGERVLLDVVLLSVFSSFCAAMSALQNSLGHAQRIPDWKATCHFLYLNMRQLIKLTLIKMAMAIVRWSILLAFRTGWSDENASLEKFAAFG
ncbi:MAG: hypothetical protein OIF58_04165 [Cohaesibacter sp.]|nr:hypothetical protein [Cohaesibacter sp.]